MAIEKCGVCGGGGGVEEVKDRLSRARIGT